MLGPKGLSRLGAGLFVVVAMSLATAVASSAQTYVGVPPPNVGATDSGRTVLGVQFRAAQLASGPVSPQFQIQARAQASRLAVTGGDLLGLLGIAAGAVVVGMVLVRSSRRTCAADTSAT